MKSILEFVPDLIRKNCDEYAGPCPWCGGVDRFVVWPNQDSKGRYYCRQCRRKGDSIDVLRGQGMSYEEAQKAIGSDVPCAKHPSFLVEKLGDVAVGSHKMEYSNRLLSEKWIKTATEFVQRCMGQNPSESTYEWHKTLGHRYLTVETAKKFRIGWNPVDQYLLCEDWGMEGRRIKIPRGLIIPTHRKVGVVGIRVRCPEGSENPRYWQVRGGGTHCLLLGSKGQPVIIVESDLDAYLIWQEVRDKVGVVSLGGTNKLLDEDALQYVEQAPEIFIATDFDEATADNIGAGQRAYQRLKMQFPRAQYLPPAKGKDPCEMQALGVPVSLWISCVLEKSADMEEMKLPEGFPGPWKSLQKHLVDSPTLVPCPKTPRPWHWVYRKDCGGCTGHIHCLKDLPVHPRQ